MTAAPSAVEESIVFVCPAGGGKGGGGRGRGSGRRSEPRATASLPPSLPPPRQRKAKKYEELALERRAHTAAAAPRASMGVR